MFGAYPSSGITLSKVISGLSKTLNIAKQVIPLYSEVKPMVKNAKMIMSSLSSLKAKPKVENITNNKIQTENKKELITSNSNTLKFFL